MTDLALENMMDEEITKMDEGASHLVSEPVPYESPTTFVARRRGPAQVERMRKLFIRERAALTEPVLARTGGTCWYCGVGLTCATLRALRTDYTPLDCTIFTLDHIIPLVDQGSNDPDNLVPCCHECNVIKSDMPLEHFRIRYWARREQLPLPNGPACDVLTTYRSLLRTDELPIFSGE